MVSEPLRRAIEFLAASDWKAAHEIVQKDTSAQAAWLHGIVHTLEGNLDNARYWYRHAEREFPGADAVQQEIAAARAAVSGSSPGGKP
jgi:ATP/maltotriose-dependent transcriptional regulator MalT